VYPHFSSKEASWSHFLSAIKPDSIVAILPEGRMKRSNGKDKNGEEMTVRSGIADILNRLTMGEVIFVYSGGLHHAPGKRFPRFLSASRPTLNGSIFSNINK
jgi:hypothetical protein